MQGSFKVVRFIATTIMKNAYRKMMHNRMMDRGFIVHVLVLFESKHHHLSNNICSDNWFLFYLMTLVSFFVQHDRTVHDE
jgi:hypothetical protein